MSVDTQQGLEISVLSDVGVTICVELDILWTTPRELLLLETGAVLTLSKATGDNINVYVGSVPFASGEVLVSEGVLGVRIAELRQRGNGLESGRILE
jgi:flagellar motor switch/type III secretory pathway protein FliN